MKKVMIALAAVALAGAAQAVETLNFTGFNEKYRGYSIYVSYRIDPTDPAPACLDLFLEKGGEGTWSSYYAGLTQTKTLVTIGEDGSASYTTVVEGEASYWIASVMAFADGVKPGSEYVLFDNVSVMSPEGGISNPTFDMSNVGVRQTGYLNTDNVPEPTSGLLMLLGMAGLALRRRRG